MGSGLFRALDQVKCEVLAGLHGLTDHQGLVALCTVLTQLSCPTSMLDLVVLLLDFSSISLIADMTRHDSVEGLDAGFSIKSCLSWVGGVKSCNA